MADKPILYKNPMAKKSFSSKIGRGTCYLTVQKSWIRLWAVVGGKVVSISSTSMESRGQDTADEVLLDYSQYVAELVSKF